MAGNSSRYGRVSKGSNMPYGTFVGVSPEVRSAYYTYGYLHDEDMPELLETDLPVRENTDPERVLFRKEFAAQIGEVLAGLTPREAKVLRMHFGIGLDRDYSLEEIGERFDVNRERIRQIELNAIRKLKHPSRNMYRYSDIL